LFAHDLIRKPVATFRDHAPARNAAKTRTHGKAALLWSFAGISYFDSNLAGCPALAGLRGLLKANPTNLIRVMPAEGDEMRQSEAATHDDVPQIAAVVLDRMRARGPRVHCITNGVAQNFTANVLLATGAVPSMTLSAEEIAAFVARSGALLVNLGTFDRERRAATEVAVATAARGSVPWVLDPVLVDRSAARADFARELAARGPKAIRLNRAEFSSLSGSEPTREALAAYAHDKKLVVGLSGAEDTVSDGERFAIIANGHPLMAKVTAMGCAASALVAACLAVEADAWRATTAALVMIGVAGELAAAKAEGPGSFAVAIIDSLHNLDGPALIAKAKAI
jgi:hydroxyethylthiazole kinase